MSHPKQRQFCEKVKAKFPEHFRNKWVLDVGSLDINGNNRYLFEDCLYTGLDLGPGPNVDTISPAHDFEGGPTAPDPECISGGYDTVISTEAFEHDPYFEKTLKHIVMRLLKPGGLFLFTCATEGRAEHGTEKASPEDAPFTNGHYRPLTRQDIEKVIDMGVFFNRCAFEIELVHHDLYFWGVKKA